MARDFPGVPFASLPDPSAPDFTFRLRNMLATIHHWAADQSGATARIALGQVPDGSGGTPVGAIGVTDHGLLSGLNDDDHSQYALLLGRAGGQQLFGGTTAADTLTLKSSFGDTLTRSTVLGESSLNFMRTKDLSNYVAPGGNSILALFDQRHASAAVYGSTMLRARGTLNGTTFFDIFDVSLNSMGVVALSGQSLGADCVLLTQRYITGTDAAVKMQLQDSVIWGASDVTCVTLNIKQRATQTGVLTRWQNSAGTTMASVSVAGITTVDSIVTTTAGNTNTFAGPITAQSISCASIGATGSASADHLILGAASTTQVVAVMAATAGHTADLQQWAVTGLGTVASMSASGGLTCIGSSVFAESSGSLPSLTCTVESIGSYGGIGLLLDDASGFFGELQTATGGLTGNQYYVFPDSSGTVLLSGVFSTLFGNTASTFLSTSSSVGASFADSGANSKRLRFVLSGAVGNNAITVVSTAARIYTLPDTAGTMVLVGNQAAAADKLGKITLTGQTASLAAQTLLTSSANAAGAYRISLYLTTTTIGDVADNVTVTLAWNDGAAQTMVVGFLGTTSNILPYTAHDLRTANAFSEATAVVRVAASTAITFTTTLTSPGAGTPAYSIDARLEALG